MEKLDKLIQWDNFRGTLNKAFNKEAKGPGGWPSFYYIMMLTILILQKLYNIAVDATEYLIKDRLSFQRFLGLALCDTVQDAKTIWNFREVLSETEVLDTVFYQFVK